MEKWVALGKVGNSWKNGSYLKKLDHIFKKIVTLEKMGHVWKNESNLEKGSLLENGSQVEK